MKKIVLLGKDDKEVLFTRTAERMNMNPSIIEKDFWVCFMLDHLFHDCCYLFHVVMRDICMMFIA